MNDADFRSLSVRDKIRELSIESHEARTKAGPMFRNGQHLTAEQMPDTWHRWNAEAERLNAEIKRLREILRTPFRMAAE